MKLLASLSTLASFCLLPVAAQVAADRSWDHSLPQPAPEPFDFEIAGNYLYAGGLFLTTEGLSNGKNLARLNLNTEQWEQLPGLTDEVNGSVRVIYEDSDGDLYFGGNFSLIAGTMAQRVVRFSPSSGTWTALSDTNYTLTTPGYENGPRNADVRAITRSGKWLYIGGRISSTRSPQNERRLLRFDLEAKTWAPAGNGVPGTITSLLTLPDGRVLAAGSFPEGVLVLDGDNWVTFAGGTSGGLVEKMAHNAADNRIYFAGAFESVGSSDLAAASVAAYDLDTATWDNLRGGFDDEIIQGNGTSFNADGAMDISIQPNGDVNFVGDFQANADRSNVLLNGIARWDLDAGDWANVGSGQGSTGSQNVNCTEVLPDGQLFVGGTFTRGWLRPTGNVNDGTQIARFDPNRTFENVPLNDDLVLQRDGNTIFAAFRTATNRSYRVASTTTLDFANDSNNATNSITGDGLTRRTRIGDITNSPRRFYRLNITTTGGTLINPPVINPPIVIDPPVIIDPPIVNPPIVIDPPIVNPPIVNPPIVNPPIINPLRS